MGFPGCHRRNLRQAKLPRLSQPRKSSGINGPCASYTRFCAPLSGIRVCTTNRKRHACQAVRQIVVGIETNLRAVFLRRLLVTMRPIQLVDLCYPNLEAVLNDFDSGPRESIRSRRRYSCRWPGLVGAGRRNPCRCTCSFAKRPVSRRFGSSGCGQKIAIRLIRSFRCAWSSTISTQRIVLHS